VRAELRALRDRGHDATLLGVQTDEVSDGRLYPLRAAFRVATGRGHNPLEQLHDLAPDIVHVHNVFPNFGRRWVEELDVPLVHTLHNYRPLCANGMLFREGAVCTLCPDGDPLASLRYACYRGSRAATLPLTLANRRGPGADPLLTRADRIVVLSERQHEVYRAAGAPISRAVIWPNFLLDELDPGPARAPDPEGGWLFVGRLSEEKGILQLLERWPSGTPLRVVGDGPLLETVAAMAGPGVEVLGSVDRATVLDLMLTSIGLVFPSLWFEGAPLVYVEALAAGLPVLAAHPNGVADSVRRDATGAVLRWEDDLADVLRDAESRFPELRTRCRAVFEQRHTQAAYVSRAEETYEHATAEHSDRTER
jgi:glycosyltransferase involved in cell wall biosynthesis